MKYSFFTAFQGYLTIYTKEGKIICPSCKGSGLCSCKECLNVPIFDRAICEVCSGFSVIGWTERIYRRVKYYEK